MIERKILPPCECLHSAFNYNPESGVLTWKASLSNFVKKGSIAGSLIDGTSRREVVVCGERFLVHRVIWKMVTGEEPPVEIDHIDCDPSNNKWNNLRECTRHTNSCNTRLSIANTSGIKGVYWHKKMKKWFASITFNYKTVHLGSYDTIEEAAKVRKDAAEKLRDEFAREGNKANKT